MDTYKQMTGLYIHHVENVENDIGLNLVKFVNAGVMMLATVDFATASKRFELNTSQIFTKNHRDRRQIIKKTV